MIDGKFKKRQSEESKKERKHHGIRKDCFAFADFRGTWKCTALNDMYCKREDCSFYKPREEVDMAAINNAIIANESKKYYKPKKGEN